MVGLGVVGYGLYWGTGEHGEKVTNKAAFLWQKFPKFVLGFLAISLLATLRVFSPDQVASLGNLSRWAFLLTFAGVGLRINFVDMKNQALRPCVEGARGEIAIAAITLGLVLAASRIVTV